MNKKLDQEYKLFLEDDSLATNTAHTALFKRVHADLNPSVFKVFSKLVSIHIAVAAITLSICPQFGFRIFGDGMGLMHYFMRLGSFGCPVACGSFFMGLSVLFACFILKGEEVRKIKKTWILQFGILALLSLGFFIMIDSDLILGFALAWLLGGMLGSLISLEIGWRVKYAY
jgi:hypothetical protein